MSFLTDIFGSTKVDPAQSQINFTPASFNGGGLAGAFNGNTATVSSNQRRRGLVKDIGNNFGELGDITGNLRGMVAPGFNDFLRTRLDQINDSARSAIGDLRQNLQSRRILGSSFGNDTITRANSEFSRQKDAATADTFLKSLQMNNDLLKQQYDAYNNKYQTGLTELNLEAGLASKFGAQASDLLAKNAQLQASLNEKSQEFNATMSNNQASGFGSFLGKVAPVVLGAL